MVSIEVTGQSMVNLDGFISVSNVKCDKESNNDQNRHNPKKKNLVQDEGVNCKMRAKPCPKIKSSSLSTGSTTHGNLEQTSKTFNNVSIQPMLPD